ncbi:MAG: glutamine amidotransferase [Clostridia bacterium]|nr:glutamine amidotransferase [Clostridia bacterium]
MDGLSIRICHLYPDLLNTYGDKGNVTALLKRCQWRNIEAEVVPVSLGDAFDPDQYDIVCIGGGQERERATVCQDMIDKADSIKASLAQGKVWLCISSGMQIMGKYYVNSQGEKIQGLGAVDFWTEASKNKIQGDVVAECNLVGGVEDQDTYVVGFESHSGRTYLGEGVEPLAKVLVGQGNNGTDGTEGAVVGNIFCSYLHGSLLPKNYRLTDLLISRALVGKYGQEVADQAMANTPDFAVEELARKGCISRVLH